MFDVVKIAFYLIIVSVCSSVFGDRTLVLLDNYGMKETYSIFFNNLEADGHLLTYRLVDDSILNLIRYGEYLYNNVVIFSNNVEEFGGNIDVSKLVQCIDDGCNVLIGTDGRVGLAVRELALECGVEIEEDNSFVVDYFNVINELDDGTNRAISVPVTNLIDSKVIVGNVIDYKEKKVAYRGSSLLLDTANPLILPVLKATKTSISFDAGKKIKQVPEIATTLMAALKARNNARVLISGSLEFFSDEFLMLGGDYVNSEVSQAIARWTFQKSGVLRVKSIAHWRLIDNVTPDAYTIMDDVVYQIEVEEKRNGKWEAFMADNLQMEFVRIDPFVRLFLNSVSPDSGLFEARFRIPDVYGVYKFKLDYNRVGYTALSNETQVSVRPLLHTQYERFILSAYPYYASAFSMMFGLFVFSFVFLYSGFDEKSLKKGKRD